MRAGLPLLAALLSAACSAPAGAAQNIPGTRVTLEEMLFLPGRDSRYRLRSADWRVCRTSDHASGARLGMLDVVLADPALLRLGDGGDCNVLVSRVAAPASDSDMVLQAPGCRFAFARRREAFRSIRVTPTPFSPEQYEKCFLRLGLFIRGFNGALVAPDAKLFVPVRQSPWSTHPRPPRFVPTFQYLLSGCSVDTNVISKRADVPRDLGCKYRVHQP